MTKKPANFKRKGVDLTKACEALRSECNNLAPNERVRAREHALRLIYGTDAIAPARRR